MKDRMDSPTPGDRAGADEPTLRHEGESWTVVGDDLRDLHVVQADNHDLRVCFLTSNGPTERRARLIAAAPDLLAALKGLDEFWSEDFPLGPDTPSLHYSMISMWRQIRAAIAKAEGV